MNIQAGFERQQIVLCKIVRIVLIKVSLIVSLQSLRFSLVTISITLSSYTHFLIKSTIFLSGLKYSFATGIDSHISETAFIEPAIISIFQLC